VVFAAKLGQDASAMTARICSLLVLASGLLVVISAAAQAQAPKNQPLAVFDIRQYGAKGDGISDGQQAIEAAIEDAREAGGGILFVPNGTFLHSGVLALGSRIVVRGNGPSSVLAASDPAAAALRFQDAEDCRVQGVRLTATAAKRLTANNAAAILFKDSRSCSVRDVEIEGAAGAGIIVSGGRDIHIAASEIRRSRGDGIYVADGAQRIVVEDSRAIDTGDDGFAAVAFARSALTDDVTFANDVSERSGRRGIACIGAAHCRIRGNKIIAPAAHGIAVAFEPGFQTRRPREAVLGDNLVSGALNAGFNSLFIDGADGVAVTGGEIDDSTPVLIRSSADVALVGLTIRNARGAPVIARDCDRLTIRKLVSTGSQRPRLDLDKSSSSALQENRIE